MAEEETTAAAPEEGAKKKKGGKLPLILILLLLVGGGGFFAMKGKGGKAPEKPNIVIGKAIEPIGEFLVNLRGGQTYLRTEIAIQFKEGFEKKSLDEAMPAIKDAIIAVLRDKSLSQLESAEGIALLRQEIAERVNKAMEKAEPPKPGDKKEGDKDAKDGKDSKDAADAFVQTSSQIKLKKIENDWDSAEGPALKIYFTSFATQ